MLHGLLEGSPAYSKADLHALLPAIAPTEAIPTRRSGEDIVRRVSRNGTVRKRKRAE